MSKKGEVAGWSTRHEILFINQLGNGMHSESKMSRTNLLAGYKKSVEHREVWGNINKDEVVNHLANAR